MTALRGGSVYLHRLFLCRSGSVANITRGDKTEPPTDMSFRPQRQRSGGIYPSSNNILRKVKLATWEDPSTPFHFGRDDMSVGGFVHSHRLYSERGGRQIAAPTVSLVGGFFQPHRLYSEGPRNGTQAVPYGFAGGSGRCWYRLRWLFYP